MEPHGRDEPQEEFMENLICGETDRIDITQVFLMESGEGDESVGRRDRPAEEEVETGLYPSDHGEDANGSGDDEEKPTAPVTKNPTVTEKPRYGACICILVLFRLCYLYTHVNALSSFSPPDRRNLPEGSREGQLIS